MKRKRGGAGRSCKKPFVFCETSDSKLDKCLFLPVLEPPSPLLVAAGIGAADYHGGEGNVTEDVERASC